MAKKTNKHVKRRMLFIIGPLSITIFAITLFTIFSSIYQINKLYIQKEALEKNLLVLEKDADDMTEEVEKLKDPEYIAKFARENYYYTKDGEFVLKFEKAKASVDEKKTIDITYYAKLGGLFALLFIVFIFIVKKIQKK